MGVAYYAGQELFCRFFPGGVGGGGAFFSVRGKGGGSRLVFFAAFFRMCVFLASFFHRFFWWGPARNSFAALSCAPPTPYHLTPLRHSLRRLPGGGGPFSSPQELLLRAIKMLLFCYVGFGDLSFEIIRIGKSVMMVLFCLI